MKQMTRTAGVKPNAVQHEIRRQFGSPGTASFLRSLPLLRVEYGMPDRFDDLLSELDRAEARGRSDGRG